MRGIDSDAPITGDKKSPDLLNRTGFAKRVATLLVEAPQNTGFAISIEGPWGSGKTSVLNLLERQFEELPRSKRPLLVRFNPWIVGTHEKLIQSFLVQLAAKTGTTDHSAAGVKAAKELLAYSSLFTALKLIPGVEPFATVVEGVINAVGGAAKKISDLKELDIERRRKAVVSALQQLDHPIIVFIDDLDRLPAFEVFEMIRLVKAVGDFPRVSYVLCYEPGYVTSALTGAGITNAGTYLDKIVQVRISLPATSKSDLADILNSEYEKLPQEARSAFADVDERIQEFYREALRAMLETPRDIRRIFNRLHISEPVCRGEVNLADLIALETLAVKAPSVYEQIRVHPELYVEEPVEERSVYSIFHEQKPDERQQIRESAMGQVPASLRRATRALISMLFPLTSNERERHVSGSWKPSGFVASRDRLEVALASGIPSDEYPLAVAKEFVRNPDSRRRIADEALEHRKLRKFLEQIVVASSVDAPKDALSYGQVLGRMVDTQAAADDLAARREGIQGSAARLVFQTVRDTVINIEQKARLELLGDLVRDPEAYSLSTLLIANLRRQFGLDGGEKLEAHHRWCNQADLEELEGYWKKNTSNLNISGHLFRAMEVKAALFLLKETDVTLAQDVGRQALLRNENFDPLILAIAYTGTDSVNGRYAYVRPDYFKPYGDPAEFQRKADERLRDSTVGGELRHSLMAVVKGTPVYLKDGTDAKVH
jgi:hypothetical protein